MHSRTHSPAAETGTGPGATAHVTRGIVAVGLLVHPYSSTLARRGRVRAMPGGRVSLRAVRYLHPEARASKDPGAGPARWPLPAPPAFTGRRRAMVVSTRGCC